MSHRNSIRPLLLARWYRAMPSKYITSVTLFLSSSSKPHPIRLMDSPSLLAPHVSFSGNPEETKTDTQTAEPLVASEEGAQLYPTTSLHHDWGIQIIFNTLEAPPDWPQQDVAVLHVHSGSCGGCKSGFSLNAGVKYSFQQNQGTMLLLAVLFQKFVLFIYHLYTFNYSCFSPPLSYQQLFCFALCFVVTLGLFFVLSDIWHFSFLFLIYLTFLESFLLWIGFNHYFSSVFTAVWFVMLILTHIVFYFVFSVVFLSYITCKP